MSSWRNKAHFQGTLLEQAPTKNEMDHLLGMQLLSMGDEGKPTGRGFLILKLGKMNCFPSWVTYWQMYETGAEVPSLPGY